MFHRLPTSALFWPVLARKLFHRESVSMVLKLALVQHYSAELPKTSAAVQHHSARPMSYLSIVIMLLWISYLALIAIRVVPEVPLPGINHRALNHRSLT